MEENPKYSVDRMSVNGQGVLPGYVSNVGANLERYIIRRGSGVPTPRKISYFKQISCISTLLNLLD